MSGMPNPNQKQDKEHYGRLSSSVTDTEGVAPYPFETTCLILVFVLFIVR